MSGLVNVVSVKNRYVFFFLVLLCALFGTALLPSRSFAAETITLKSESGGKEITLEWVAEPKYLWGNGFYAGAAWFQEKKGGSWKLIDKTGKVLVDAFRAKYVSTYSRDTKLASFQGYNGLHGYVDLAGKVVISPQFEEAGLFVDGLAKVGKTINGEVLYGVIDRNGKTVLPIRYKRVENLRHNRFGVGKIGEMRYVDEKGEPVVDLVFKGLSRFPLSPGVCMATLDGGKVGLLDEKGKWVLPPEYSWMQWTNEEPIAVTKEGKVGYVDMKGKTVIDFRFHSASSFSEGLAVVSFYEKEKLARGVIDKKGTLFFRLQEEVEVKGNRYNSGFLLMQNASKRVGLIDRAGNQYWLPRYLELDVFTGFSEDILLIPYKRTRRYGGLKISTK